MRYLIFSGMLLLAIGCASQKETPEATPQTAGPQVQKWMNTVKSETDARLPVIVRTTKPVTDSLLRPISPNHYTARLNQQQLKALLNNPDVKKITTGKEKLH